VVLTCLAASTSPSQEELKRLTCEEFLALSPEDQQTITSQLSAYRSANGDTPDERIARLAADCAPTPKATIGEKLSEQP
jgi:hypothetical protein